MPDRNLMKSALRKSSSKLIKSMKLAKAAEITGDSITTVTRYYAGEHDRNEKFLTIDQVAALEGKADFPYVTKCLADFKGITFSYDPSKVDNSDGKLNNDVINLSEKFAKLMMEYNIAIADSRITLTEAQRLLSEITEIQKVLIEMKLHLEQETHDQSKDDGCA